MFEMTTKPMSAETVKRLQSHRWPKFGLLPLGMYLILVPIVLAGMISAPFRLFHVMEDTAPWIGLGIGYAVGMRQLIHGYSTHRRMGSAYQLKCRQAAEGGIVQRLKITAVQAWEVDDLEDFGPGYVFDIGNGTSVYLCDQQLPYVIEEDAFPANEICVEFIPDLNEIIEIELTPGRIPISEYRVGIDDLGIDVTESVRFLSGHIMDKLIASQT